MADLAQKFNKTTNVEFCTVCLTIAKPTVVCSVSLQK